MFACRDARELRTFAAVAAAALIAFRPRQGLLAFASFFFGVRIV
ncbi:MAG TPA: hypothetical protein VFJ95_16165 [Gammaproteobacteria bacterium]|nr:hypothetical protein [Gammaproteobacteria bacterium]